MMPSPSPAGRITWPMKVAPRLPCPPLSLRVRRGFHRCPKWRSPRHEMRDQNGWELRWFWWIQMGQGNSRKVNFQILRGFKGVGICNCADGLAEIHESWIASCWVLGCYHLSFLVWDSHTGWLWGPVLAWLLVLFCRHFLARLGSASWQSAVKHLATKEAKLSINIATQAACFKHHILSLCLEWAKQTIFGMLRDNKDNMP